MYTEEGKNKRRKEFKELIGVNMRNAKIPEPIVDFSEELYVNTGIERGTIQIFKYLQAQEIIENNKEALGKFNEQPEILQGMMCGQAAIAMLTERKGKTSEEFEEHINKEWAKFGGYPVFRVCNAMHVIKGSEDIKFIEDLEDDILSKLKSLAKIKAEELTELNNEKLVKKGAK